MKINRKHWFTIAFAAIYLFLIIFVFLSSHPIEIILTFKVLVGMILPIWLITGIPIYFFGRGIVWVYKGFRDKESKSKLNRWQKIWIFLSAVYFFFALGLTDHFSVKYSFLMDDYSFLTNDYRTIFSLTMTLIAWVIPVVVLYLFGRGCGLLYKQIKIEFAKEKK